MRNLLSDDDILAMRKELIADATIPHIPPPAGREFWNVHRIVDTLEYFRDIEEKYNSSLNPDSGKRREG